MAQCRSLRRRTQHNHPVSWKETNTTILCREKKRTQPNLYGIPEPALMNLLTFEFGLLGKSCSLPTGPTNLFGGIGEEARL